MTWQIKTTTNSDKSLDKLDPALRKYIKSYLKKKIAVLENPRAKGKPLKGRMQGLWRYRVNKYRIVCRIQDEILTILVVKIGKRDEVYED